MLSRVANSIYWMSRYMERAGNIARVIDVNFRLMLDLPAGMVVQWDALVRTTGDHETFMKRYQEATRAKVLQFLIFDPDNPNSILSCVRAARENARSVREIISSEMWEQVNKFYLTVTAAAGGGLDSPQDFFTEAKLASHLFVGLAHATMSRGQAWHFSRIGRTIERADKTSRLLDVKYFILLPTVSDIGTPLDELQWTAVLGSASALEAYRQRYGRVAPERTIEFLVLDRDFPRSIHYCINQADRSLHEISGTPAGSFRNRPEQLLGQLRSELDFAQVSDIIRGGLHEFLDTLQTRVNNVGTAIHDAFFAIRPAD
ncbi:MAG: alpha-E domain-containing protein [Verrucomicrobiales bacterium]